MAANLQQIKEWFNRGVAEGHTHMVVICDTYDHEDYPRYAKSADEARSIARNPGSMARTMEVYLLRPEYGDVQFEMKCANCYTLADVGVEDDPNAEFGQPFDLVLYHGNCWDGLTAAWVARNHSPGAEIVAVQYGQEPPDVEGKRVLVVDFSYPRETILAMHAAAKKLLVLDHHEKAQEALEGLDFAYFDMNRSGAGMAWDYLADGWPRPEVVSHVEDRDIWKFQLEGTREHHAFMASFPMTIDSIKQVHETPLSERLAAGKVILRHTQQMCERLAARARKITIDGHVFWICNTPLGMTSEVGEMLYQREPTLPAICWSWGGTKGDYYCSCRSRKGDGIDVGAFCVSMGGGGHRHAAGFRTRIPPPFLGLAYDTQERYEDPGEPKSDKG